MLPNSIGDLNGAKYSDASWQKAKSLIDKATKTGLGVELIALKKSYDGAKETLKKLDAGMVPKMRNPDDIKEAKAEAEKTLAGPVVSGLITKIDAAAKKATAVSKMKISKGAIKAATDIANGLNAIKKALEDEKFADFDAKLDHMQKLYDAQRKDFKPAAKLLIDTVAALEKSPVLESIQGTAFSGAYRGFQNKIGNLPEFKDIYDDKFDGLFYERMDTKGKTEEEIKKELLKIATETKAYLKICLVRAKEKGY